MDIAEVTLDNINLEDETYRISEDLDPAPLEESLREIGQLNPVILLSRSDSGAIVVSGFRRLRALKRFGAGRCLARFLTPDRRTPLAAFRVALWDNLSHRLLDPLEKARVLYALKHTCGVGQEELVESYLRPLGLAPHKNVLKTYLGLHVLDRNLKRFLAEGRITAACAERLAGLSPEAQIALSGVLGSARFSASLQRQLLDLVDDLAAIQNCGADEVVRDPEIVRALNDSSLSPYQRGEAVFKILYRQRNPRLSEAHARFVAGKDRLGLPGSVRVTPDPFFEQPRIHVEFEAPTAETFREIAGALDRAARTGDLAGLFQVK
jgi:ParB-like chromosome segregation protein Spo0J